jgi:PRTRC genetic system ParB family protein
MKQPSCSLRRIKRGRNPRKYFDPAKMADLRASIRAHGVLEPVMVRPIVEPDYDYELIGGGRRCEAAELEHGLDYDMPIVVHDVDEVTARMLALVENIQRDDLAPSEEAAEAAEIVGLCKGDRDEAARQMGWSREKLESRLALMNCSNSVLEALNTRSIKLGVAELLAALTKADQDKVLPVIVAENRPVADVRKLVEAASCSLASAIFDKTDCAGCSHNSAQQGQMFGEAIGTGNCTNRHCFNEKTEKQLEAIAANQREEFPVVRIVRPGDNHTRIQLVADGPSGVGEDQAKACRACQNFGVAVSGLPDSLGKVYRGQCFDTTCNMKKVAARIAAEKAAAKPAAAQKDAGKGAASSAGTAGKAGVAAGAPVTSVADSERVKTYRVALWRKALRRDIGENHELARQYLIALALTGNARCVQETTFGKFWERLTDEAPATTDIGKAAAAVKSTSEKVQANLMLAMLFAAIEGIDVPTLTRLCKHHGLDLTNHWKLSKDFLELITKSEMKVLADELGIGAALGDNLKKVFAKSKDEVIEALLAVEGFDYVGKVPKVLKF